MHCILCNWRLVLRGQSLLVTGSQALGRQQEHLPIYIYRIHSMRFQIFKQLYRFHPGSWELCLEYCMFLKYNQIFETARSDYLSFTRSFTLEILDHVNSTSTDSSLSARCLLLCFSLYWECFMPNPIYLLKDKHTA